MVDVIAALNELNTSLQGKDIIFDANEKIPSFKEKLTLWKRHVSCGNFANFPTLDDHITQHNVDMPEIEQLKEESSAHLIKLADSFDNCFQIAAEDDNGWIRNPFTRNMDDDNPLKDELIELFNSSRT